MGFFDVMRRMMEGRPAFEDEPTGDKPQTAGVPTPGETPIKDAIRKGDDNSFPVVYVTYVTTRFNGDKMQAYGRIKNTWPEEIMLDKIRVGGAVREIDNFLRGGEEREFLLYDGPKLTRQEYEAQLDYKTQREGDYFQAVHDVKYTYHGEDKTYSIDEMHLRRPIRDIYG